MHLAANVFDFVFSSMNCRRRSGARTTGRLEAYRHAPLPPCDRRGAPGVFRESGPDFVSMEGAIALRLACGMPRAQADVGPRSAQGTWRSADPTLARNGRSNVVHALGGGMSMVRGTYSRWMKAGLDAWMLGIEASTVVTLRTLRIAAGAVRR